MKRTTVILPDDLHETLRQEAFKKRMSMGELIRSRLELKTTARKAPKRSDPLDDVVGIGSDGALATDIDEALYGV